MATEPSTNPFLGQYFGGKSFKELLAIGPDSDPAIVRETINSINEMMEKQAKNITYTQLRNILQEVKKEEFKKNLSMFYFVIPKLAYMEARPQKKDEGKKIITFIREMANEVETAKEYNGFEEIMDALVAYHKLHG